MHWSVKIIPTAVGGVVVAVLTTLAVTGCSGPASPTRGQQTTLPFDSSPPSIPDTSDNSLAHCPDKVKIKVHEVITRPAPDAAADGWGFGRGERVPCIGRRDCWFRVEVPNPSLYADDREHWIPVSVTNSELAYPGGQCFDPDNY